MNKIFLLQSDNINNLDLDVWWYNHKEDFPNLFKIYLQTSCVPASSASAERSFSTAGNILTEKRSRILPQNLQDLMLLRNNLND